MWYVKCLDEITSFESLYSATQYQKLKVQTTSCKNYVTIYGDSKSDRYGIVVSYYLGDLPE